MSGTDKRELPPPHHFPPRMKELGYDVEGGDPLIESQCSILLEMAKKIDTLEQVVDAMDQRILADSLTASATRFMIDNFSNRVSDPENEVRELRQLVTPDVT